MRNMRFRRTDQPIDEYTAEYDLLRRKADAKMEMGTGFPDQFVTKLRLNHVVFSRHAKSAVVVSSHNSLRFKDASANSRRLFGPRGGGSRQGALIAEEAAGPRASDD